MASAAGVWSFPLAGAAAGQRVVQATVENTEVHRISGLDASAPLVVTATTRTAGSIVQSVAAADSTTTVTRSA